ncbi:MAG: hypothetical protein HFE90_02055 [Firmicutes bacterium]|nr:hypothetical protein [Bacillota bacterium]
MIISLILSLILTQCAELFAVFLLGARKCSEFYTVFLVNVITNPAAVYIAELSRMFFSQAIAFCALIEVIAVITESFLYGKYLDLKLLKIHNSFIFSFVLNSLSFAAGVGVNYIQEVL